MLRIARPRRIVMSASLCAFIAAFGLGLAASSPAAAAADAYCGSAEELAAAGLPRQALALATSQSQTSTAPCLGVAAADARARIERSQVLAHAAVRLASVNRPKAEDLLAQAGAIDAENETFVRLAGVLPATTTRPQAAKSRWDGFVERYLDPLSDVLVPFLAIVAGILVVARLATTFPVTWPPTSKGRRRALLAGGLAAATAAALVFVVAAPPVGGHSEAWVWIATGVLGLVSVLLLTTAMATRMRLAVEVRDKDAVDEVATGQVIALLAELGGEPPNGLEVPRGSDVTVLDGTPIAGTPESRVLKALLRVWQLLPGVTPWRVRVDAENQDVHAFVITRNGHTVASGVIDRDLLGLRAPIHREHEAEAEPGGEQKGPHLPDLHRFAAAAVLVTLSRHSTGFAALWGMTDWRSLGLHYVATTDYAAPADKDAREAALVRAIEHDRRNLPAMVAFRHSGQRESTTPDDLAAYLDWLIGMRAVLAAGSDVPWEPLRLRVHMSLVCTACNYLAADGPESPGSHAGREARLSAASAASEEFVLALKGAPKGDSLAPRMCATAAAAYLTLHEGGVLDEAVRTWLGNQSSALFSPTDHYNHACHLLRPGGGRSPAPVDEVVSHLRQAAAVPRLREWMRRDPSLTALRSEKAFRHAFSHEPRRDLLVLAPLEKYAEKLRSAGLHDASALASTAPQRLAGLLGADVLVAEHLIMLGRLADALPRSLADFQVEITAALVADGIEAPHELTARLHRVGAEALTAKIAAAVDGRCERGLSRSEIDDLAEWLQQEAWAPRLVLLMS